MRIALVTAAWLPQTNGIVGYRFGEELARHALPRCGPVLINSGPPD